MDDYGAVLPWCDNADDLYLAVIRFHQGDTVSGSFAHGTYPEATSQQRMKDEGTGQESFQK